MSVAPAASCEIVLIHSVLGLRPGAAQAAEILRHAGHLVHTPDLFDGRTFDDLPAGMAHAEGIGMPELFARSLRAVADLPNGLVYIGFSLGGDCAEYLAANRPGARAAILLHSALPVEFLGPETWPGGVPVQVHFAREDPFREQPFLDRFAGQVRSSGASCEICEYPVSGNIFTDPSRPEYNRQSADGLWRNVLAFLHKHARPPHP